MRGLRGYDGWKTRSDLDDWAARNHREWIDGPEEEDMKDERKADVWAKLAELEHEIALAIRQGVMDETFNWTTTFSVPSSPLGKPEQLWIAVLTTGRVM